MGAERLAEKKLWAVSRKKGGHCPPCYSCRGAVGIVMDSCLMRGTAPIKARRADRL